jgi:hypothetical protein
VSRAFYQLERLTVDCSASAIALPLSEFDSIFGDSAQRLVAARLQSGEQFVQPLKLRGRLPDRFRFDGRFIELKLFQQL